MSDPIYTIERSDPNPTTVGEMLDWIEARIAAKQITRDSKIDECDVALRVREEMLATGGSTKWLHITAESRGPS